jgi:hypothetical protein
MLPDFARARRARDIPVVIMHQYAFAVDYQKEEYWLIGMAIKLSGICGKEVCVRGRNREAVDQSPTTHESHVQAALGVVERWPLLRD